MKIRKAVKSDLEDLDQIMWEASWSNEGDRVFLDANRHLIEANRSALEKGYTWLAEREGKPIGYASYVAAGPEWELDELFVAPDCMRHGVATALLDQIIHEIITTGADQLFVSPNPHSMEFYEASGFVMFDKMANPGPRLVMELDAVATEAKSA